MFSDDRSRIINDTSATAGGAEVDAEEGCVFHEGWLDSAVVILMEKIMPDEGGFVAGWWLL